MLLCYISDYRALRPDVEEGICQVLAHMWLESEIMGGSGSSSSSSRSSSSSSSSSGSSKKGKRAEFERKLGEFFKFQIEADTSHAYGDGFRSGIRAVNSYGLRRTLDHIKYTSAFP
jgi:Protein DA1